MMDDPDPEIWKEEIMDDSAYMIYKFFCMCVI